MKVVIETIPHKDQRYPTEGDYWWDEEDGSLQIRVSVMGNPTSAWLTAIHELVEAFATGVCGISEPSITDFDTKFEKEREQGLHGSDEEPGDAVDAPYRDEHSIAEAVTRMLCGFLSIPYREYYSDEPLP